MSIEECANDILTHVMDHARVVPSQLALIALAIKTDQQPGEATRLRLIQLRTVDKIYVFNVQSLSVCFGDF